MPWCLTSQDSLEHLFLLLISIVGIQLKHYRVFIFLACIINTIITEIRSKWYGLVNQKIWQASLISSCGQENPLIFNQRLWSHSMQLQSTPTYKSTTVNLPISIKIRWLKLLSSIAPTLIGHLRVFALDFILNS